MKPENGRYVNHLMTCSACLPRGGVYCPEGRRLRLRSDAEFVASLPSLEERREWLTIVEDDHPEASREPLRALVKEFYSGVKGDKP